MIDLRIINLGDYPNDPNADSIYEAFTKVNFNFENLSEYLNDQGLEDTIRDTAADLIVNGEHTNIDVEYIPLARRLDIKFNGSNIQQDLIPGSGAWTIGTQQSPWSAVFAQAINVDTIEVDVFTANRINVETVINTTNEQGNIVVSGDADLDFDNLAAGTANTALGAGTENIVFDGSNNTVIGAGATPSNSSASNEVTIGNNSVDSLRIPGVDFYISNGTVSVGSDQPIENITYNGDAELGQMYSTQHPMPGNQKLQVHGNVGVAGTVSAERVDTYLDAGYF